MADTQLVGRLRVNRRANTPLHEQIGRQLRERIAGGELKPGDKLPSLQTLCRTCRVSVTTAQRVLDDLSRAGLTVSRHGAGTFVASERAVRTTEFFMPVLDRVPDRWMAAQVEQIRVGVEDGFGHDPSRRMLTTFDYGDGLTSQEIVQTARSRGADCVIGYCNPHLRLLTALAGAAAEIPCVSLSAALPGSPLDSVTIAPDEALRTMLTDRLARGVRRFAYVGGARPVESVSPYYPYGRIYATFRSVLAEAGIAPECLIYRLSRPWLAPAPGDGAAEWRRHADLLAAMPAGTAVVTHSPSYAEGLLKINPRVDAITYTECRMTLETFGPQMSMMYLGAEDMARAAVRLIRERLEGVRTDPRILELRPEIVEATG